MEHNGELETVVLTERGAEFGLACIGYMRLVRKIEGVKASRAVFGRAWKDWSDSVGSV